MLSTIHDATAAAVLTAIPSELWLASATIGFARSAAGTDLAAVGKAGALSGEDTPLSMSTNRVVRSGSALEELAWPINTFFVVIYGSYL